MRLFFFGLISAVFSLSAVAQVTQITLPADTSKLQESTLPGYAIAQQKCGICHSADYIHFQPPAMGLEQWTEEMNKMQHSYGAPITPDEIEQLGAYLAVAYGSANEKDPAVVALTNVALAKAAATTEASGSSAAADDAAVQTLLSSNACLGCHAIDRKVVGPGFKDVAARYKDQDDALASLKASIRSGGSGKWGNMAMPPMPGLSDADLEALAGFILGQ